MWRDLHKLGGTYADLCTPEREGAIRWAYTIFEACDGAAWVPLRHCSRSLQAAQRVCRGAVPSQHLRLSGSDKGSGT